MPEDDFRPRDQQDPPPYMVWDATDMANPDAIDIFMYQCVANLAQGYLPFLTLPAVEPGRAYIMWLKRWMTSGEPGTEVTLQHLADRLQGELPG